MSRRSIPRDRHSIALARASNLVRNGIDVARDPTLQEADVNASHCVNL
jgi:hypothetical protein